MSDNQKSLNKNFGNIWDSQWRSTASSIHNIYEGNLLKSATTYFWKVRIKDSQGEISDWSQNAQFTTGILGQNDWQNAQWITDEKLVDSLKNPLPIDGKKDKSILNNQLPLFRKSFAIDKKVKSAYAFVAGLGHFEFFVNPQLLLKEWFYRIQRALIKPQFRQCLKTMSSQQQRVWLRLHIQ